MPRAYLKLAGVYYGEISFKGFNFFLYEQKQCLPYVVGLTKWN